MTEPNPRSGQVGLETTRTVGPGEDTVDSRGLGGQHT